MYITITENYDGILIGANGNRPRIEYIDMTIHKNDTCPAYHEVNIDLKNGCEDRLEEISMSLRDLQNLRDQINSLLAASANFKMETTNPREEKVNGLNDVSDMQKLAALFDHRLDLAFEEHS